MLDFRTKPASPLCARTNVLLVTAIKCPTPVADKKHGSLEADLHAVRTAQGKDGDTNVHSRVAAISYHVGPQSKAS